MFPVEVDQALNQPAEAAVAMLASLPEGQWFERKSGRIKPAELAVPLVAMANAEGGVVVVGLSNGQVDGVSDAASNTLRQAAIDYTRPRVRVMVEELAAEAGRVLVFRVAPGEQVHETHKGECYQRIGDESRRLTFSQRQELEWDRGVAVFSATPVAGIGMDELDQRQLASYQRALGSSSSRRALAARDLLTREGGITVAGYLLFAERPQMLFPSAHVRVLKYADIERGTGRALQVEADKDVRCEGSLPHQISEATAVMEQFMPRRQALAPSGRFEAVPMIPRDAWLEGLVNAVVHRSYSIAGDHIRVEIFPNRVEITSPGRFPGMSDPTNLETISRHARNPRIARVCADLGITRELGEGIRRIFAEMRRVGLADPMYLQTPESVRLTLLASSAIPPEVMATIGQSGQRILDALRQVQRPLGTGQIAELVGLARPTVIRHMNTLRESGLVVWEGDSPRDPRATWRLA